MFTGPLLTVNYPKDNLITKGPESFHRIGDIPWWYTYELKKIHKDIILFHMLESRSCQLKLLELLRIDFSTPGGYQIMKSASVSSGCYNKIILKNSVTYKQYKPIPHSMTQFREGLLGFKANFMMYPQRADGES